ncbi:MAG: hypothetical protein LQ342_007273 [Letrouitia transgressa]|nr:MAG: hypothetical protein LQ342_007273 [Letrouitia transgressa]
MKAPSLGYAATAVMLIGTPAVNAITTVIDGKTYSVEYYNDCSTLTSGVATVTGTAPAGGPPAGGFLTTYVTEYPETCSTGLQTKTYTVTEPCSNPGAPRPSNYIPQAFTVTTVTCHVCGETPLVATLTTPVPIAPSPAPGGSGPAAVSAGPTPASGPPSAGGAPAAPPPAGGTPASPPAAGGAPANPPAAGGAPASPPAKGLPASGPAGAGPSQGEGIAGAAPAGNPPSGNSPPPPGGAAPAAPYYPATQGRTGVAPTGASVAGSGNSSTITPFTGSASHLSLGLSFVAGMLGIISVLTFAL